VPRDQWCPPTRRNENIRIHAHIRKTSPTPDIDSEVRSHPKDWALYPIFLLDGRWLLFNSKFQGWTWTPRKRHLRDLSFETWGSIFQPFFEVVQKTCHDRFSYLLRVGNFCKGPRTLQEFPQKCHKIAGCWVRRLCTQPPIASTPGSSPPERPGPDNITSQPWFVWWYSPCQPLIKNQWPSKKKDTAPVNPSGRPNQSCMFPYR